LPSLLQLPHPTPKPPSSAKRELAQGLPSFGSEKKKLSASTEEWYLWVTFSTDLLTFVDFFMQFFLLHIIVGGKIKQIDCLYFLIIKFEFEI
jgi:hypothetical protein